MNKLIALFAALLAFALMTGTTMAADMSGGGEPGAVANELGKQLSPNIFGPGYFTDGVSHEKYIILDTHFGVAPAWEVKTEDELTRIEKTERGLWNHLSPNAFGTAYSADGVSDAEFSGTVDTHYGVAPLWEDRTEEPTMVEKAGKELWEQMAPNEIYNKDLF